jgi:hypothetical protein
VKRDTSKKTWSTVSLFRTSFNKSVADYSFTGNLPDKNIGSSPDFSTDGTFPKCWVRENNSIVLVKAGTSGAFNAGYEPYSEVFACQLANYLGIPVIQQTLGKHKGVDVSKCKCICNENIGIIKLNELVNKPNADFEWLLSKYDIKLIHEMLMLDCLLCNVDRHFGNIWLYTDENSNAVRGFTEVCDNNLSCIPYYVSDEPLKYYIDDIRAKDGRTWEELLALLDKSVLKEIKCKARNFKFKPLGNKRADSRIEILNNMLKYQISKIK